MYFMHSFGATDNPFVRRVYLAHGERGADSIRGKSV